MDRDHSLNWEESADNLADNSETKPNRPITVRSQFLDRWLNMNETKQSKEDDDSEESVGSKNKKRFRKVFKRLFPSIATKESGESKPASFMPPAFEPPFRFEKPNQETTLRDGDSLNIDHNAPENPLSSNDTDNAIDDILQYEDVPEARSERVVHAEESHHDEFDDYIPPHRESRLESEFATIQSRQDVPPADDLMTESSPAPRYSQALSEASQPNFPLSSRNPEALQIRTNRGDALLAFLVADLLSRRRDRKLRRGLKKVNKQVLNVQKSTENLAVRSKQKLEQIYKTQNKTDQKLEHIAQTSSQSEGLRTGLQTRTESLPQPVAAGSQSEKVVNNIERIREHENQLFRRESLQKEKQEREQRRTYLEHLPAHDEKEDTTPEAYFDRRHEILDEATPRGFASANRSIFSAPAPTPVATILQSRITSTQAPSSTSTQSQNPEPAAIADPQLYRQSMQYGFGAALLIVIFALIIYALQ